MTTTATEPKFLSLPLDWVIPHPHNVRRDLGDLESLAESISVDGILEPLIVTPAPAELAAKADTGSGLYLLLAGHRRLAAATKAGLLDVPCIVRTDLSSLTDQIVAMLNENDHRSDLNPVEQADAYQELLDLGLDVDAIAARRGRPKRHVQDRLKLGKAPTALREKVTTGEVSLADALIVQSYAKHPDLQVRLEQAAGSDKWGFVLEEAERAKKRRTECAKITRSYKAQGIAVFVDQAEREKYRLDKARELNTDLLWSHAGAELPDDAETCGGMVAGEFEPYSTRLRWIRLVPEDIDTTDDDTPSAPSTTDIEVAVPAEPDTDADAKLREDLAVAATLRRRHIADTLSSSTNAHDTAHYIAVDALRQELQETDEDATQLVAGMLGIDLPDPNTTDAVDELDRRIIDRAQSLSTDQLVVLTHVLHRGRSELVIEDVLPWQPGAMAWQFRSSRAWITELGEWFGYEWTDTEAELIDRLNAAEA